MADISTVRWLWLNMAIYALLLYASDFGFNYGLIGLLLLDCLLSVMVFLIPLVNLSIIGNLVSVIIFQLSLVLARPHEPFANGYILLLSFTVFVSSLFLPKSNLKAR